MPRLPLLRLVTAMTLCLALLSACDQQARVPASGSGPPPAATAAGAMDSLAEQYVRLALAFGQHDESYVDAYFGPPEWRADAVANPIAMSELRSRTQALSESIRRIDRASWSAQERRRHSLLAKRVSAIALRIEMTEGNLIPFDEESAVLFDAVAPHHDPEFFRSILAQIDALLPGAADLSERVQAFRARFVVPTDRVGAVFAAAIAECRARTLENIELPANESFELELVTNRPWSGYNWYKGNYFSLIQINTDLPIYVGRAVELGCHEGYPGHHTYNALLERELVNARGWIEFTLSPLYGPQSLISEGSANYGIELALPREERLAFERDVLFPLAGLDPADAERYRRFSELLGELDYAINGAARDYVDGATTAEQAIEALMRDALSSRERAEQQIKFVDTYRSYVINYNLGQDLVRDFITRNAGDEPTTRWRELERLLSEPFTPSDLLAP